MGSKITISRDKYPFVVQLPSHNPDEPAFVNDRRSHGIIMIEVKGGWCEYEFFSPTRGGLESMIEDNWGDEADELKKTIKDRRQTP